MRDYFIKENEIITIGRDKKNSICIADKVVSSFHATIIKENNTIAVTDNNSVNGTFVNGNKFTSKYIKVGDVVKIGSVVFKCSNDKLIIDGEVIIKGERNIQQGNYSQQSKPFFDLSTGFCSIGRDQNCTLTLDDKAVSKNHAMIKKQGNEYLIIDNNSMNGTFVNGNKISTNTIKNNDQIKIGESVLYFANGKLYNDMPNVPTFTSNIVETLPNKKYNSSPQIKKKKHNNKKLKLGALIAASLVFVLLITIVISSFDNTKSLARFDELDEQNTPSIGEMAFASPYYYVDNGRDTGLNKDYAKYMSVLISDTLTATDLIMEKYEQTKSTTDRLYQLVMETGSMCDNQFGTNYMGEQDTILAVNEWRSGAEINEEIYQQVKIKNYDTDMEFADAVGIKAFTSVQAERALYEEFMLLSSMGATLYKNHLGDAPHEVNDNLEKIKDIVSDDKIYKDFTSMNSYVQSIFYILRYKESADIEVAIENLEDTLTLKHYIIRDLQEAQKSGKFNNEDIMDVAQKSGFTIGMSESLLETLKVAQENYQIEYENSYLAIDEFSILTKAYADNNSNFGKSIDIKASAKKASEGSWGSIIWDAVSSAGSATWKYGTAAGRGIVQLPADATYYISSKVAISFLSGKEKEYRTDIVNKKLKEKYENYFNVDKIGIESVDNINDAMKAVSDKGKEYGNYVGGLIDDTIHDVTKATTGGDPKIRPMEWIGTQIGDVLSGTITGVSGSTVKLLDPKSTTGDLVKAGVDLGLAFSGAKGGKATDIFNIFDSVEILKGYATGQLTNLAKDGTDGMIAAIDDINSEDTADNPNQVVGDFNISTSKNEAYFGEKIEFSVKEITDAEYLWYLDDADGNVIRAGNSITSYYLSRGYHYPKVEIYNKDGKLLGSATTDVFIERYDLDIDCSETNPFAGDNVRFTVSSRELNFDGVQIGWDRGDGNVIMGGTSNECNYAQPGNYTVSAVAFKNFDGAGDIVIGMAEKNIQVQMLNQFELIVSKTNVLVDETITFSVEPWLERTKYIWVIGGQTYEGAVIDFAYNSAGTDYVEVQVQADDGMLFEDSVVITVEEELSTPKPTPVEPTTPDNNGDIQILYEVEKYEQLAKYHLFLDDSVYQKYGEHGEKYYYSWQKGGGTFSGANTQLKQDVWYAKYYEDDYTTTEIKMVKINLTIYSVSDPYSDYVMAEITIPVECRY